LFIRKRALKGNAPPNQWGNKQITMATTTQMYDEIARILRVTRNNVEYEAERNKSQLLCDVATTLGNLATLVDNISIDLKSREISNKESDVDTCNNLYMKRFTTQI